MSENRSGWTVETLKEHVEQRFDDQQKLFTQALAAADKAVDAALTAAKEAVRAALASGEKASEKTEAALKEYKAASNEWRDTVKDLVSRMPTRDEVAKDVQVLVDKVQDLRESRQGERSGRALITEGRAWVAVAISAVLLVLAVLGAAMRFWGR